MADAVLMAKQYCTDGNYGYLDVIFPGKHIFHVHNKKDAFTLKGGNADLRHYIPTPARRSRWFPRKPENQFLLSLFGTITVSTDKKCHTAPCIIAHLFLSLSLISFKSSFEHSHVFTSSCFLLCNMVYCLRKAHGFTPSLRSELTWLFSVAFTDKLRLDMKAGSI